jgi:tetratricopeptide (TPR) repeat protein
LFDYDWEQAARQFALAVRREFVPPSCRLHYACYLMALRRPGEAVEQMQHAVEEDPLYPMWRTYFAVSLWLTGRDQEAFREMNETIALDENFPIAYAFLAQYHCVRGAFGEALPFAAKAHSLAPHVPTYVGILAGLLVRTGDGARAQEILAKLGPPTTWGAPRALAFFHQILGETDRAADCFEQAIEQRDGVSLPAAMPLFKPLRESPRWPKLAKMMNLPEGV